MFWLFIAELLAIITEKKENVEIFFFNLLFEMIQAIYIIFRLNFDHVNFPIGMCIFGSNANENVKIKF